MTDKQYKKEVINEIKNLRKHLTEEQKGRLDFGRLRPKNTERCIYGQITGHCCSNKAKELVQKCASKTHSHASLDPEYGDTAFNPIPPRSNESIIYYGSLTALEYYIANYPQNNEHIINYIKGIDKRLRLK